MLTEGIKIDKKLEKLKLQNEISCLTTLQKLQCSYKPRTPNFFALLTCHDIEKNLLQEQGIMMDSLHAIQQCP